MSNNASAQNEVLQNEAIQRRAQHALETLQNRINEEEAMGVPSSQHAPFSISSPPSTPRTIEPPNVSAPTDTPSNGVQTPPTDAPPSDTTSGGQNNVPIPSITQTILKQAPSWIADAQARFERVFSVPNERPIVSLWLEFEELLGHPEDRKIRLTNEARPQQVSDWMQRHRQWDKAPIMDKASEFGALWKSWWKILQPEWRTANGGSWPLGREKPEVEEWTKLMKGGGNGFLLVLLSLSWWMMREKDESRKTTESSLAFEDVQWVLDQMVHDLRDRRYLRGGDQHDEGEEDDERPKKR